ncbi:MAG: calcium-binding protein [Solirubrobacterales bacterium]
MSQRSLQIRTLVLGALIAVATVFSVCPGMAASSPPVPSFRVAHRGRCLGRPATIVDHGSIHGTAHADVIIGSAGDDHIFGGGGNDRICAGGGDDTIAGGTGSDRIEAGAGKDEVIGGNGSDLVLAGPGTDTVFGERGNDRLYGGPGGDYLNSGLGDDTVGGGPGNGDLVIGGVGNDHLSGGPGNGDVLEGDLGTDSIDGGPGAHDTVSYALAGQSAVYPGGIGVNVNLAAGTASGDGDDTLSGIEDVAGTPFADTIAGDAGPNELYGGGGPDELIGAGAGDAAFGGTGLDLCRGVAVAESCELHGGRADNAADEAALIAFEEHLPPTFEVDLPGGPGTGDLTGIVEHGVNLVDKQGIGVHVAFLGDAWVVTEQGLPMAVGAGCSMLGPETASCPTATTPTGLLLDGGEGADLLALEPSIPATVSARLIGGNGADSLIGGAGNDSLNGSSGPAGGDQLYGGPGDDAIAEGSVLDGEGGSDLLIAHPCGETIDGGPGIDSVSFARSTYEGVEATLGGTAGIAPYGSFPGGCPTEHGGPPPSQISSSVERIEGSPNGDILTGDGGPNVLLGRGGDDEIHGAGGNDFLVGGQGSDAIYGEAGADRLYARDGRRDKAIDCGPSLIRGDVAFTDPGDPPARKCTEAGLRSRSR